MSEENQEDVSPIPVLVSGQGGQNLLDAGPAGVKPDGASERASGDVLPEQDKIEKIEHTQLLYGQIEDLQ